MNTFTFTGRVVADHDGVRQVGDNKVLNFRVASDVGFSNHKSTLWLSCALWNKRAEALAPMLSKGQFVAISGELSQREYEKDGQTRTALEVRVGEVDLGPKVQGGSQQPTSSGGQVDDEVPF
ncbi:single-strand binding protein [Cribrihabitans marinus]|uniref:Single-stranded DNA-binding protein n=1 Tax=Cribrihabitans marinus TaxID=1227549 RepID=A0A1H6WID5_9RHOB|nr:single-stranded DNA-binding protein [Cribrihabitans marinus]GGH24634.1 single-stranded DNA-binding protein 2 [Cribrihabitans marinus]SEJ12125.1 single-strand binding protein [Cribrihabitans marinus]